MRYALAHDASLHVVEHFEALTGQGASGTVDGHAVLVGNEALMREHTIDVGPLHGEAERLAGEARTPIYVAVDGRLNGLLAVADPIRSSSHTAIQRLRALGLDVVMLTGDNERTAQAVARAVGIDRVVSGALPAGLPPQIQQWLSAGAQLREFR